MTNSWLEYTDDTEIIPKDSTVLARRLPAQVPGKGRAARYVSGKPPASARANAGVAKSAANIKIDDSMTEEQRIAALLKMNDNVWQQKQEEMSHEQRVAIAGRAPMKKDIPKGEPPASYTCYRCNEKGMFTSMYQTLTRR